MTQTLPPKTIILYADDDADDLHLMKTAFVAYSQSIELITFENGVQLLNQLQVLSQQDKFPSLIILDINMPLLTGKEVLLRLRGSDHFEHIPVVLFSNSTLPSEKAFAECFNALFVTKPLDIHQMNQIVEQFIDHCPDAQKRFLRKRSS
jgi:CheY-like chemotaxis protein